MKARKLVESRPWIDRGESGGRRHWRLWGFRSFSPYGSLWVNTIFAMVAHSSKTYLKSGYGLGWEFWPQSGYLAYWPGSSLKCGNAKLDSANEMLMRFAVAVLMVSAGVTPLSRAQAVGVAAGDAAAPEPAFEVATIKPVETHEKASRYIVMQGNDRFVAKYYTVKLLIAAAYDLNPREISGGAEWVDSDHYDILALTPGLKRPSHDEQMAMLRALLAERFKLSFHREPKEFSIYALEVNKGGPKYAEGDGPGLKASTAPVDDPPALISTVYPDYLKLPARNATMADFVSLLQRAVLDRPVVDRTGLAGRFDFDLTWAADETQFGGEVPTAPADAQAPPLFTAIQEQLGLRLEATRGPVEALVVDTVERPTAN